MDKKLNTDEVRCGGCGSPIHKNALRCPHCHFKINDGCFMSGIKTFFGLILLIIGILILIKGCQA